MLIPYDFEDIPKQPLQAAGESSKTGWKNHACSLSGPRQTAAPHVMSLLILPQPKKPRMAEVVVRHPLNEVKLPGQLRLQPPARLPHFSREPPALGWHLNLYFNSRRLVYRHRLMGPTLSLGLRRRHPQVYRTPGVVTVP